MLATTRNTVSTLSIFALSFFAFVSAVNAGSGERERLMHEIRITENVIFEIEMKIADTTDQIATLKKDASYYEKMYEETKDVQYKDLAHAAIKQYEILVVDLGGYEEDLQAEQEYLVVLKKKLAALRA